MNPIQKAWLKLLSPVSGFVNEKLAKRSGILGRLGRFFLIGPREYGVHPINKMFIYINRRILFVQGAMLHRYSAVKFVYILNIRKIYIYDVFISFSRFFHGGFFIFIFFTVFLSFS